MEHTKTSVPCLDAWIKEAKEDKSAPECGMYLFHNGIVRQSARAKVRQGDISASDVKGMVFSYDKEKVEEAVENTQNMPGIGYVRVWLNEGQLEVGDDIMLVLVGGDIRPHVVDALQSLVGELKNHCVKEEELF